MMDYNTITALTSFSALQQQIDDICGRVKLPSDIAALSSLNMGAMLTKTAKPHKTVMDVVIGRNIVDSLAKTNVMTNNIGLEKIASVTAHISSITGVLSATTKSLQEAIAPMTMIMDLQKLVTQTRMSVADVGTFSAWRLGVLDCASQMVDRQVNWASNICTSVYGNKPIEEIKESDVVLSHVNIISILPDDLEQEKKKDESITAADALLLTDTFKVSEMGKSMIEKIVAVNKACKRNGKEPLFANTDASLVSAATIGGTVSTTRETFANIIDCLYIFFYENLERIKSIVSDVAVRNEDVFQCIFRVKNFRTDYRHDYEHGKEKNIKKKEMVIGESYRYYAGKPVLVTKEDFVGTQFKLYSEFETLVDYLLATV